MAISSAKSDQWTCLGCALHFAYGQDFKPVVIRLPTADLLVAAEGLMKPQQRVAGAPRLMTACSSLDGKLVRRSDNLLRD